MYNVQGYRSKTLKVSDRTMKRINKFDEHPFFTEYVLIHEGTAQPNLIGEKSRPIIWTKLAIQSFYKSIKTTISAFINHNADNSTKNRCVYGTLVEKRIDKLDDGSLAVVGVFYHDTKQRKAVEFLDIISHEGKWNFKEENGKLIADTCDSVTGFALGNSKEEQPAFKLAKKLATVQCMDAQTLEFHDLNNKDNTKETRMSITFNDVAKFISENSIKLK